MFGLITGAITLVFSTLLPTFLTYKALSSPASQQSVATLHPWLTYWITNSLLMSIPRIVPFDSYLRLGAHIYLLIPGRAEAIYQSYVRPWLQEHEGQIEEAIGRAHDRGKAQLWEWIRAMKEMVAGLMFGGDEHIKQQHREQELARLQEERTRQAQGVSYVQSLLGRWSSESRVQESMAAAKDATRNGPTLATKLGGLVSAAASVGIEQAQNAVNSRNASGNVPDSALSQLSASIIKGVGGTEMRKNKSETDFEKIEPEDAPRADLGSAKEKAASWGSWVWGAANAPTKTSESSSGKSSAVDTTGS